MKYLLMLLICFNAFAGSFIQKDMVGKSTDGQKIYLSLDKCEKEQEKPCIDIAKTGNYEYHEIKPASWSKQNTESCSDQLDCQEKLSLKTCEDSYEAIKNLDTMEVYCTKYNPEKIGNNSVKKAEYDAAKELEKQKKDLEKAELQEVKDLVQTINDSNLPSWHKKILKRLIKDMKGE